MSDETIYQLVNRRSTNPSADVRIPATAVELAIIDSGYTISQLTRPLSERRTWGQRVLYMLLWLEPLWIAMLMPSLLFRELFWDAWLHPWLVAALFLFWPIRLLAERRFAPTTPLNWPIFALLLWLPMGIWVATDGVRAWQATGFLALGLALYIAFLNWPPTQRRPWLLAAFIVGCGLLLTTIGPEILPSVPTEFFVFSKEVTKSKPINYFGVGETINPNVLAGGLLWPIPLLVALAIRTSWARRRWLPPFLIILALPGFVTLVLVQSRGGYLALAVALMLVITLRWPWAGVAMSIAVVTTSLVLLWEGAPLFLEPFGSDGTVTSFSGRLDIWQGTLTALGDYGLTGVGLGNFDLVVPAYLTTWTTSIPHAHNLFLQIAVDLGVPGVIFYGWLLVQTGIVLVQILRNDGYVEEEAPPVKRRRRSAMQATQLPAEPPMRHRAASLPPPLTPLMAMKTDQQRAQVYLRRWASLRWALAAGLCAAFGGMLVHGMVDAVSWGTKLAFMPWLLYALVALLWLQAEASFVATRSTLDR
jgi:putative inorganic carbon (HCO3(-)) transporter